MKEIIPKTNQVYYVLLDDEKMFLDSCDESNIFTTPFITRCKKFDNPHLAKKFSIENDLNFKIIRVNSKYEDVTEKY